MDNINIENGKASIAYVGEKPWHGLGTEMKGLMTAKEAIEAAHLDWDVGVFPVFAGLSDEFRIQIPRHFATVRIDTRHPFGVVGPYYTPIQNREAFEFFDGVVADKQAHYEVCGALGYGETIWILANLEGGDLRIGKTDDIVKKYLLLTNTHNGTMSLRMFFTPIRVVCQNTLSFAMSSRVSREGICIRHFPNIQVKLERAREMLGFAVNTYDKIEDAYNALNKVQFNNKELDTYIDRVFPQADPKQALSTRLFNQRKRVRELFDGPENSLPGIRGSAWAAYNSVTQYVDHDRTVAKIAQDPTKKLSSIWLGGGANLKETALSIALEEAGLPVLTIASLN